MNPWTWWTQIRERRGLKRLAKAGKGSAVRVWAVSPEMTAATQRVPGADQAATIRAWLARQLSATAPPYGITHAVVGSPSSMGSASCSRQVRSERFRPVAPRAA